MSGASPLVLGSPAGSMPLPDTVTAWLADAAYESVVVVHGADDLLVRALRGRPSIVVLDAREREGGPASPGALASALDACRRLKRDSYTAIVPTVALVSDHVEALAAAFAAGADEVLHESLTAAEVRARLDALVRRAGRDTEVHPTTRLPGTTAIEADLDRRIAAGSAFAAGYADLDHFKEYNDRYGYNEGDRVIRMLALVLHDVVKGLCGEQGFVGHIGGDDFIFVVPLEAHAAACDAVIETFDTLVPLQYSDADRRAGYYFGKDRRGQLHRVPLMTLSIGVVTTERRRFTRAAEVSHLASEMKSYAKSKPGSLYAVDRRHDESPLERSAGGTVPPLAPTEASASR